MGDVTAESGGQDVQLPRGLTSVQQRMSDIFAAKEQRMGESTIHYYWGEEERLVVGLHGGRY